MIERLRKMIGGERGFALVTALGITVVLGMSVVTVIEATTANSRNTTLSKNRLSAYALAEAGINNASSILAKNNPFDQHVLHPQAPNQPADCASPPANPAGSTPLGNTCSPLVFTYDGGGTATVSGWLEGGGAQNWHITSVGEVRNPFSTAPSRRTLTATVHVRTAPAQDNYVTAWNYVMLRDTTPGICNLIMQNSSSVNISLYVQGNICFQNSSSIAEDDAADAVPQDVNLLVLGRIVYQNGSSKGVGDTAVTSPANGAVTTAKIRDGCATSLTGATHTCARPGDYFYAQSYTVPTTGDLIPTPVLTDTDFTNYYNSANIRPGDPCDSPGPGGSRLANSTFDNDATPLNGTGNNGSAATFDLTPSASYTCRATDSSGVLAELDWDNVAKILTVRGTIYIDGSLQISQAGQYRGINAAGVHPTGDYTGFDGIGGQAVIYASGGLTMTNSSQMCGWNTRTDAVAKTSGNCDFNLWTPNTSMLMIVTHKSGAASVNFSQSAQFQGGIYAVGDVSTGQSVWVDGPMLVNSITIGNSVRLKPIPGITDLPIGAPGNPNTSGIPTAPSYGG